MYMCHHITIGVLPDCQQAIILTNALILLIGPSETFKKMYLELSGK